MTEKRITDIWCNEMGHIGFTYDGVDLRFEGDSLETFLNELVEENEELKKEKEYWKNSACHDMNLKSMLSFEIGKLIETKDVDSFLDFYYKYFCKISGDVD